MNKLNKRNSYETHDSKNSSIISLTIPSNRNLNKWLRPCNLKFLMLASEIDINSEPTKIRVRVRERANTKHPNEKVKSEHMLNAHTSESSALQTSNRLIYHLICKICTLQLLFESTGRHFSLYLVF